MKYNLLVIKNKKDLDFFRQVSEKVKKTDSDILTLVSDMYSILYNNNAIGLAGVMVGALKRVVVVDLQENNRKKPITLLNPEIVWKSDEIVENNESSISLEGIRERVPRFRQIKVKYFNTNFDEKIIEADGLLSICLQHEIDYLDGKLFIDYLDDDKKNTIINSIVDGMKVKTVVNDIDILRTKCKNVEKIDDNTRVTLDKMLKTMYENRGIGLAANQVGLTERLVVIDLQEDDVKNPIFLVNPEIVWKSKETACGEEGCLSVPSERAEVIRFKEVKVKYLDKDGTEKTIEADGLLAVCLQHEIDHLNGKIFIDHLSKIKKDIILKKLKKND
jgi:peptide deformylase